MKIIIILAIILCSCGRNDPEPVTSLTGTKWKWFEFNRTMHNMPVRHYLEFTTQRSFAGHAESEGKQVGTVEHGTYKLSNDTLTLTYDYTTRKFKITGDKIIVRKTEQNFDFYERIE